MGRKLSEFDIEAASAVFGIETKLVRTIIKIESSGSGFDPVTGIIKIQFEPHIYNKYTGMLISNGVESQAKEWRAYEIAFTHDKQSAMLSTSWGLGQIMGFNHKAAGFVEVAQMVSKFKESEFEQLTGMLKFISANKHMFAALKAKDWDGFASRYNGADYKRFNYHTKLANTYNDMV